MNSFKDLMLADHRHCDVFFASAEQAAAAQAWDRARASFSAFQRAMEQHFAAEEKVLFPAFERANGMTMGPTQVMRDEHVQMNQLMAAAQQSLDAQDGEDFSGNTETLLIMMQQHNMKEEHVLYPMCDDRLRDQAATLLPQLSEQLGQVQARHA